MSDRQQQQTGVQSSSTATSDRLASALVGQDADQRAMSTSRSQETFSIATPVVTNTSKIGDSFNEASFLPSATSYQLAGAQLMNLKHEQSASQDRLDNCTVAQNNMTDNLINRSNDVRLPPPHPSSEDPQSSAGTGSGSGTVANPTNSTHTHSSHEVEKRKKQSTSSLEGSATSSGKKKGARKGAKLDTKSKLEKSRQSARECRARKKLRYQYLEDLVSNREKAVVKLREELSMFCEMSQRIDEGSISEPDRHLLIEQTKENSKI